MGRPKALLPRGADGDTFLHAVAAALCGGGVEEALIVGRPDDEALRAEVDRLQLHARFVANPHADMGQLSSLQAGLESGITRAYAGSCPAVASFRPQA